MIKTDKQITDFYEPDEINYTYNRLIGLIYKNPDTKEYYHQNDFDLNLEKNDEDSILYRITEEYQYRPDLISKSFYGDEKLYWVILEHNNIVDPFELELGLQLEIPDITKVKERILEYKELYRLKRIY